ncbi:MAG: protease, partial [Acidobacteria bacterium]|nr:protease [Acidobacteriota bacterium]
YEEVSTHMFPEWEEASMWRHYRGGRTHPISVMNLSDHSVQKLPWNNSNDSFPMWVGDTIYFVSDRNHIANLFSYKTGSRQVAQLTNHEDFDIMNASAGADAIVYEQAGYVHLVDTKTGRSQRLNIDVTGDLPWARPQFKKVANMIRSAVLSPTGVRAAFEARGEIFTVPAEKGDFRNLTQNASAHDRSPVWSPDGAQIAWLSDASGEYQLMLGEPTGVMPAKTIPLPTTGFYSAPAWSPDGKQILLEDNHNNLWMIEAATGKAAKIDTDNFPDPFRDFGASWSSDSKWITYSKNLPSHLRAIFIYSLDDKKSHQVTDGLADSISPTFDAGGKYLYFLSSTDYGPSTSWLEMSSLDRPVRRSIYLAVLSASEPSPLLPETDDEPMPAPRETPIPQSTPAPTPATRSIRIDPAGIGQRIISVNVPAKDYRNLSAGPAETFFYTEPVAPDGGPLRLQKYQIKQRKATPFIEGIRAFSVPTGTLSMKNTARFSPM